MSGIELPAIERVMPHEAPMMLLDKLLESGEDYLLCRVVVRDDGLFDHKGRVPAWLGIEYMAQSVAAFSGLESYRRGEPAKLGFLLGTRRFETDGGAFRCGEELAVRVERVIQGSGGMAVFDCTVSGEKMRQSARLSVYGPSDVGDILGSDNCDVE